jgi:hypothetical protein
MSVNVWSLIRHIADDDCDCQEFVEKATKRWFGNEFTAELDDFGTLIIRVFNCYDEGQGDEVEIRVMRNGGVIAKRQQYRSGVRDERKVSF